MVLNVLGHVGKLKEQYFQIFMLPFTEAFHKPLHDIKRKFSIKYCKSTVEAEAHVAPEHVLGVGIASWPAVLGLRQTFKDYELSHPQCRGSGSCITTMTRIFIKSSLGASSTFAF